MHDVTRSVTEGAPATCRSRLAVSAGILALLAGCSAPPAQYGALNSARTFDARLGVWSSPRLVAEGETVPRGGGSYLTGRPYTIAGRTYVPSANASGYSAVGMASWYGDAFHGRRTANGEIFDKYSISAAHPTLPLPSYVRVTNTKNGRSIVVRVNDRGPYHGGRVMDVSQRVAEALQFRGEGTARVRIEYIGRAGLAGSDDARLMASLRTDGAPAQLDGMTAARPSVVAEANGGWNPLAAVAAATGGSSIGEAVGGESASADRLAFVPVPPSRPFDLDEGGPLGSPVRRADRLADLTPHAATSVASDGKVPTHP